MPRATDAVERGAPAMRPIRLLALLALLTPLVGCGGDEVAEGDSEIKFSGSSSDYNGYFSNYSARLGRSIGRDTTTITVDSGARHFRIVLRDDVLKKGERFDLDDSGEATATYDEGSDKVWVAVSGRAEVTEEVLGKFTVRLRSLRFEAKDDESNEALGDVQIDGRLIRR